MNSLMVEAHGKWSFLQVCHLRKVKGKLFQVPSTSVPTLVSSTGDSGIWALLVLFQGTGFETMSSTVTMRVKDEPTILGISGIG